MGKIQQEEEDRVRQEHHKLQICTILGLRWRIGVADKACVHKLVQIQQRDHGL